MEKRLPKREREQSTWHCADLGLDLDLDNSLNTFNGYFKKRLPRRSFMMKIHAFRKTSTSPTIITALLLSCNFMTYITTQDRILDALHPPTYTTYIYITYFL